MGEKEVMTGMQPDKANRDAAPNGHTVRIVNRFLRFLIDMPGSLNFIYRVMFFFPNKKIPSRAAFFARGEVNPDFENKAKCAL
jgi:hypothetical protein